MTQKANAPRREALTGWNVREGRPGSGRPLALEQLVALDQLGAGRAVRQSAVFLTNCDLSPIWPTPGILQSMS